jgi:hypothetical protein
LALDRKLLEEKNKKRLKTSLENGIKGDFNV